MAIKRLEIAPPYLQFFISDPLSDSSPIQTDELRVLSDGQCISVPCRYAEEGSTELIVGTDGDVEIGGQLQFDDFVATPNHAVLFSDAELAELLLVPVSTRTTRIRIWTDGSKLPSRIAIAIN